MGAPTLKASAYFHKSARDFDDLYTTESRGKLRRWFDSVLRASVYRRFELTFERLGDLKGKRVLDVGCGGGRYSITAHGLGAEYVLGIDFAPNMIELASKLAQEIGADREKLCFRVADFTTTQFDDTFDAGIVMGVFDYVADPKTFLSKLAKAIEGRVVASFPVRYSIWTPQRKLRYHLIKRCPLRFYSRSEVQKLLQSLEVRSFQIERARRDFFVSFDT